MLPYLSLFGNPNLSLTTAFKKDMLGPLKTAIIPIFPLWFPFKRAFTKDRTPPKKAVKQGWESLKPSLEKDRNPFN